MTTGQEYGTFEPTRPVPRRRAPPAALFFLAAGAACVALAVVGLRSRGSPTELVSHTGISIPSYLQSLPPSMRPLINASVDPCVDFHEFACGAWETETIIPKQSSHVAYAWSTTDQEQLDKLRKLLGADTGIAGKFFQACSDYELVKQRDLEPLQPWLALVDSVHDRQSLARVVAQFHRHGKSAFFGHWIGPDHLEPTSINLWLNKGGLNLPHPHYYTKVDAKSIAHREAYKQWAETTLRLIGREEYADQVISDAITVETDLAEFETLRDMHDVSHVYEPPRYNVSHLSETYPNFDWRTYFAAMNHSDISSQRDQICVARPLWMSKWNEELQTAPMSAIRSYLLLRLLYATAPLLPKPFLEAKLTLSKHMYGIAESPPRWQKCVRATKYGLPFPLSKLYAQKYFPESEKKRAEGITEALRAAFQSDLDDDVSWMSAPTRAKAKDKLAKIKFEVAYPNPWPEFHCPLISATTYFENNFHASHCKEALVWETLRHPVSRTAWQENPLAVNAYYRNGLNTVFIPLGLLEPPFFDAKLNSAYNFGAAGSIMGHELTHGFDNVGRKFDAQGRKHTWWDAHTIDQFEERTACVAHLYNGYTIDGLNVHGWKTVGEDIADMGGLRMSYLAFDQTSRKQSGGAPPPAEYKRIFWTAFAQTWCDKRRRAARDNALDTSVHAPDKWRLIGCVSQNEHFARTSTALPERP
eukprot:CAMPEP_0114557864 /NCGR_PEP_ID=MMETSP0114-20121206/10062_1 /TAXON_ID=31324 /ORGANISM="Goniomonas sp, Strain m" /LENGTH=698 /DNA_ID=CAMNT_0001743189 /DNA_START=42 /DNA_END=2138 /DNA_ORIENTATION=+